MECDERFSKSPAFLTASCRLNCILAARSQNQSASCKKILLTLPFASIHSTMPTPFNPTLSHDTTHNVAPRIRLIWADSPAEAVLDPLDHACPVSVVVVSEVAMGLLVNPS